MEKIEIVPHKMGNSSTSKRSESDNGEKYKELVELFCS